ncbi:hypothetical protein B5C26_16615 [Photorhabdus luminescens]|uniref:Uncharacterized protein n=1 Tax=Photorhabdus luminescens subsp. mexicana TaxID=2100167 RepID=A0A4R4J7M9_PHOLU|nr:hypothetical protein [Photorhabdus luminescens]OWO80904.1 hypothetical protein B5C26_16615 [Photorhabdus luminescens]TDB49181.1 hypothetical protein C5468_14095 [Photorhabdus luminescens subsp. mexicana]
MLGKIHNLTLRWFTAVRDSHVVVNQYKQEEVSFSDEANNLILIVIRTELWGCIKNLVDAIALKSMLIVLCAGLLQLAECIKASLPEGVDQHDLARLSC